jgi:hypothetical protein
MYLSCLIGHCLLWNSSLRSLASNFVWSQQLSPGFSRETGATPFLFAVAETPKHLLRGFNYVWGFRLLSELTKLRCGLEVVWIFTLSAATHYPARANEFSQENWPIWDLHRPPLKFPRNVIDYPTHTSYIPLPNNDAHSQYKCIGS